MEDPGAILKLGRGPQQIRDGSRPVHLEEIDPDLLGFAVLKDDLRSKRCLDGLQLTVLLDDAICGVWRNPKLVLFLS